MARSLTIYNSEHFDRRNGSHEIRQNLLVAAGYTVLSFSLTIVMVANILEFGKAELAWTQRAFHLALMLGQLQQFLISAAMTRVNRQITDALGQLQSTVESRK